MGDCCSEPSCHRKQPIRVLRGGLTGDWYVVTKWSRRDDGVLVAKEKHRLMPADIAAIRDEEA